MQPTQQVEISSHAELTELIGQPLPRTANKARPALHALDRDWLAAAPFCLIATSDETGRCDVSPKGDPPGFTLVLNDTTLAIPDRPGNRRVDSFHNILANPHIGLLYLIPGRGDTLRINGRARLVSDAPFFDQLIVKGNRPKVAIIVDIEEVFYHCSKAFLRSMLWNQQTWNPEAVASRPRIAQAVERPEDSLEELETYYGPTYAEKIYG